MVLLKNDFYTFSVRIFFSATITCSKKCLKFKVPKMPKVKDDNHFIKDRIPQF